MPKQKTFNVWAKKLTSSSFIVCSKIIEEQDSNTLRTVEILETDGAIDGGANIRWCDVSHWFKTLDMEEGEVKSFKLTFKEN